LYDEGQALAFAAVDFYRRAHGALELALADYAALDIPLAAEAMATFRHRGPLHAIGFGPLVRIQGSQHHGLPDRQHQISI